MIVFNGFSLIYLAVIAVIYIIIGITVVIDRIYSVIKKRKQNREDKKND